MGSTKVSGGLLIPSRVSLESTSKTIAAYKAARVEKKRHHKGNVLYIRGLCVNL